MTAILCERIGDIALIRLNRPDKLNALSAEMFGQLDKQFTELENDSALRVLIITGAGERSFCAGTDIAELKDISPSAADRLSRRGQDLCNRVEHFPVPVIAAVNGKAVGGGCELVLACHLRIASTNAEFSLPELKLGMIPGYGGTQRLPREIGRGRAVEIMLTGKSVNAEEAFALGIVNRVVPPAELLHDTLSLAKQIASLSPLSIRACLKAVNEGLELPLEEGLALERELFASLFASEDVKEGTRAFLEKRKPLFLGK